MKTCFKCNQIKTLLEFYSHAGMKDGRLGKCKDCCRKDSISNRSDKLNYYKDYDRKRSMLPHRVSARNAYQKTERGKASFKKSFINQCKLNPLRRAARIMVGNALRDGHILKNNCEACGDERSQAHHDNYYEPLNVRWLCRKCHNEWHKLNIPRGS